MNHGKLEQIYYCFALLCLKAIPVSSIYSILNARDSDIVEVELNISDATCALLPMNCTCSSGTVHVVNDEMDYAFVGSSINCSDANLDDRLAEYFEALQHVLDDRSYRTKAIAKLDFRSNGIRGFSLGDSFARIHVRVLDLSVNPIAEMRRLYFNQLSVEHLEIRDCDLQKITRLTGLGLRNLKGLSLSRNKLKTINSDAFAKSELRYLNLSCNPYLQLRRGCFGGLESNLELIDLSGTNQRTLPITFEGFEKLRYLYLQHNQIASIDARQMQLLPRLLNTVYHLENNLISWIDQDAFVHHEKPFLLYADDNRISDLSFLYKHDPCIFADVGLSLNRNEVHCSCSLLKFLAFNTLVLEGKCAKPSILTNLNFRYFENGAFLEELFDEAYFAQLERNCKPYLTKGDNFTKCRCRQMRIMSSLLAEQYQSLVCSDGAESTTNQSTSFASFLLALHFAYAFLVRFC